MKKVLYGSTALLAAGMFTAAAEAATPLKLTVGGYLNAFMGYTNLSEKDLDGDKVNKFALGTDGEIAFTAETKLDNGIKVGAVAEIVVGSFAKRQGWLDDVYAYAESKYGKVELGATDNAAKKLHNGAPEVGPLDNDKIVSWLGLAGSGYFGGVAIALGSTTIDLDGNARKISYFSPKFYGFQVGASYIPGTRIVRAFDASRNGAMAPSTVLRDDADFTNAYVVSADYEGKLGGVTAGADVAYGNFKPAGHAKSAEQYSFGADVAFSGFTIGAGYTFFDENRHGVKNTKAFEFGAAYENGPYAVSANYFLSKNGKEDGEKGGKLQKYEVSGKYKLGAGVDAFATFAYLDLNKEARPEDTNVDKVWTVITGLALNF